MGIHSEFSNFFEKKMKIFAILSSAVLAAPTLSSSMKDMYMLSMMENGNVNPLLMASILGKSSSSSDSPLWKEFMELNLLTQGQVGSGNFFTANMLNNIAAGVNNKQLLN